MERLISATAAISEAGTIGSMDSDNLRSGVAQEPLVALASRGERRTQKAVSDNTLAPE